METIRIKASTEYYVHVGQGILADIGVYVTNVLGPCKAVIVSDDNVYPLYGSIIEESLRNAGFSTVCYVFPHGEKSKSMETYQDLIEFMSSRQITRTDVVIALGGGVTGDLAGFAAATYQRGIPYVQVPTTLLAAVDSSVGGKTAINLTTGKNQAGCFYQPAMVLCDIDTFVTLPEEEYRNGCVEVIKYAVIGNQGLFEQIQRIPIKEQYEAVISACVAMKGAIVEKDEYDTGSRMLLNLGHTFGHAAEALSDYRISHGNAVAMGLSLIVKVACKRAICDKNSCESIINLLKTYDLPVELPYTAEEVYQASLHDKKGMGEKLRLVVPEAIGSCQIITIDKTEIPAWLEDGGLA